MLGIGFAVLLGASGGLFWWKVAAPFNRLLKFSEEENGQLHTATAESMLGLANPCVSRVLLIDSPADSRMTEAIVKLSSAVKAPVRDHAIAR